MARFYIECKQLLVNGEEFISSQSRSKRSAAILCHWPGVISIDCSGEAPVRVGIVSSFIQHSISVKTDSEVGVKHNIITTLPGNKQFVKTSGLCQ